MADVVMYAVIEHIVRVYTLCTQTETNLVALFREKSMADEFCKLDLNFKVRKLVVPAEIIVDAEN